MIKQLNINRGELANGKNTINIKSHNANNFRIGKVQLTEKKVGTKTFRYILYTNSYTNEQKIC